MTHLIEPERKIPIIHDVDVCVLGGSCTGVFAAVRAARLGKRVVIVEQSNAFGGTATNGMVIIWHSQYDTEHNRQIIGGLTMEVVGRMEAQNGSIEQLGDANGYAFNSEEMKIELDALILEHAITPMLHTVFCAPLIESDTIRAVFVENKDGRQAIRAKVFIDATGDGDLAASTGIPFTIDPTPQPPTTCAKIRNFSHPDMNYHELYHAHYDEFGLEKDSGWHCDVPGLDDVQMVAETHVFGVNCADATELTRAEMTGRRQTRAIMDMIRRYGPQGNAISLVALASHIGIRETRRFQTAYHLTEDDVLYGKRFDDAIANGSYRVDVHHPKDGGFLFKYLDGSVKDFRYGRLTRGRWREATAENPTFYQIPYRCMIHKKIPNLIMAGRMIGSDKNAFGAIRVMVNLNQTGEAAGVAAALSIDNACSTHDIDLNTLRQTLAAGGSIII